MAREAGVGPAVCGVLETKGKECSLGREWSTVDHEAEETKVGSDEKRVFTDSKLSIF